MIELRTLGSVSLRLADGADGSAVLRHDKALALLGWLAARPAPYHRRDTLAALLWPEADQAHGRGALRKTLFQLRAAMGSDALPGRGGQEVRLGPSVWCDVRAFHAALEGGRPSEALALYRGEFLEGFHVRGTPDFERWMEKEREALRGRAARAALDLARPGAPEGLARARRALELQPWNERALARLMELLDLRGERAQALHAYHAFERRLAEEMDVEPSPEVRALARRIRDRSSPHRGESGGGGS